MPSVSRREFIARIAGATAAGSLAARARGDDPVMRRPNVVVIFTDDLGYGDLGCFGHPTIHTPELDRMAAEGMKLTQFYVAAAVCTPSRAGLLTGRLPIRSGMTGNRGVLFPDSGGGLPGSEITIAQLLRDAGYATGCFGKWHLGHRKQFLPTRHGFDEYFGIPYSNDMKPCPVLDGEEVIEEPAVQETLTPRYTERAVSFIRTNRDKPFFLYVPHTYPHVPLHASPRFAGKSRRGLYGDVVEELDWSTGVVLQELRDQGLERDTLVIFTSDNGPWLTQGLAGGTAGPLRDGKESTWEGGLRVPCIAWWPGTVPAGTTSMDLSSTLDFLPTCAELAGAGVPGDRTMDGASLVPLLRGGQGTRTEMAYYRGAELDAYRVGPWKAHYVTRTGYGNDRQEHDPPLLFNLERDEGERHDVAARNPDVIERIAAAVAAHKATVEPVECQLDVPLPAGAAPGDINA